MAVREVADRREQATPWSAGEGSGHAGAGAPAGGTVDLAADPPVAVEFPLVGGAIDRPTTSYDDGAASQRRSAATISAGHGRPAWASGRHRSRAASARSAALGGAGASARRILRRAVTGGIWTGGVALAGVYGLAGIGGGPVIVRVLAVPAGLLVQGVGARLWVYSGRPGRHAIDRDRPRRPQDSEPTRANPSMPAVSRRPSSPATRHRRPRHRGLKADRPALDPAIALLDGAEAGGS